MIGYYVPVSHVVPSYPGAHVHVNALIPSVHVAPLWQGFEMHSFMSETGIRPCGLCFKMHTEMWIIYSTLRRRHKYFIWRKAQQLSYHQSLKSAQDILQHWHRNQTTTCAKILLRWKETIRWRKTDLTNCSLLHWAQLSQLTTWDWIYKETGDESKIILRRRK